MIYEVINPSDPITIEAKDLAIAQASGLLLGRGQYGLTDENGRQVLPMFFGSGSGLAEWLLANNLDLDAIMKDRWAEVEDCLESVVVADVNQRKAILALVGPQGKEAIERFNEESRSSTNNIAGRAIKLAKAIRDKNAVK